MKSNNILLLILLSVKSKTFNSGNNLNIFSENSYILFFEKSKYCKFLKTFSSWSFILKLSKVIFVNKFPLKLNDFNVFWTEVFFDNKVKKIFKSLSVKPTFSKWSLIRVFESVII